jgi:hypothetical protein
MQRRREDDEVPLVVFPVTQPPPAFILHAQPVSVVSRPVDRVTQAMQQGCSVRLLTHRSDCADASSSSSSSLAAVTAAAPATAPGPLLTPPLQA